MAGHRDQLRVELAAEDAGVLVALRAGEGAAAQRAVDVDAAVGDDSAPAPTAESTVRSRFSA